MYGREEAKPILTPNEVSCQCKRKMIKCISYRILEIN